MKLSIAQMVLERCEFSHQENYMSIPSTTPVSKATVDLGVQLVRDKGDKQKVVVRLLASAAKDATYRFAITYAVLLMVQVEENEQVPADIDRRLMVTGCTMMFPYMRQVVSSLSSQGRFGPIWLSPTDFNRIVSAAPEPEVVEAK
jgi:preprotein translocase subunit SecB